MKTTIDKAGRVVVPAAIRERLGLTPGTELEVTVDDLGVRLVRNVPGPALRRLGNRLVVRATADVAQRPSVDVAALIDAERDR
jgi:AbrB family looped-hinge helix DNA binding protein